MKQSEWFKTKAPDGTSEKEKIEKEVLGSPYIAYVRMRFYDAAEIFGPMSHVPCVVELT